MSTHLNRLAGFAGLAGTFLCASIALFVVVACDDKPAAPKPVADKYAGPDAAKKIAEDKSLTDEQAINAYIKHYPYAPTMLPKGQNQWAVVQPFKGGGYLLFVKRFDPVFLSRMSEKADGIQSERDGLKQAAEFCHLFLTDLQPRGLKGISFTFLGSVTNDSAGEAQYADMFRAFVTPEDLPKIAAVKDGPAAAGSAFDPRGDKYKDFWAVDTNLYPQIEYRKRSAK